MKSAGVEGEYMPKGMGDILNLLTSQLLLLISQQVCH
jgi:hypothetical protein